MPARSVTFVLLCAVVALAGCTGVPGASTTATPAAPTPPTSTPSDPTATPLSGVTPTDTAALTIENPSGRSVTVDVYEQPGDGTPTTAADTLVANRTTSERRLDFDDTFQLQTDYRVVVTVDGTTRWNQTVYDYESYTLSVEQNGTVRVSLVVE